jgi:hypothetical protein
MIYHFKSRQSVLTPVERQLYGALTIAIERLYHILAQVHLASIVDGTVVGQNWRGAFRHIDEKSVDFLLCDVRRMSPVLAIELDNSSHLRADHQARDWEVERILRDDGLPLLRLRVRRSFDPVELADRVAEALGETRRGMSRGCSLSTGSH